METNEILTMIKAREQELNPLYTRMQDDLDLYLLKDHVTEDIDGNKMPEIYNVTYDLPQTWADHAMNVMGPGFPKMNVTSTKLQDIEKQVIYRWWAGVLYSANQRFECSAQVPIYNYMTFQTCITGWNIARAACWVNKKQVVWDITPCDAPTVAWETTDRIEWISLRYDKMKKSEVKRRFNKPIKKDTANVVIYWGYDEADKCVEIVFIDEKQHTSTNHKHIKRVPFVVQPVPITPKVKGSHLADITMLGESIFKGARGDFKEMNDAMSFLKTQVVKDVKHPVVHKSPNPTTQKLPGFPGDAGAVLEISTQEEIADMPTRDNMATTSAYMAFIDAALQRRTTPHYDYGSMDFELSAVAMDKVSRQIAKVLGPRIKTLNVSYKGIFELLFEQFIDGNFTDTLIDAKGNEFEISAKDLKAVKGKFQVSFSIASEESEGDTMILQKVQQAKTAGWPERYIDEHISKFEDIDKVNEWRASDSIRMFCPEITMVDEYQHTKEKAKASKDKIEKDALELKASLIEARIGQIIAQETAGNQSNVRKVG